MEPQVYTRGGLDDPDTRGPSLVSAPVVGSILWVASVSELQSYPSRLHQRYVLF